MFETFQVQKKLRWEMGHRLSLHQGKCHNLHGHSYSANILVEARGLSVEGMVVDFYNYKPLKEWVDEYLDHAFMINDTDPIKDKLVNIATLNEMKLVIINFEPTAENIAKMLAIKASEFLNQHDSTKSHEFIVRQVEVWETADCSAIYTDHRITLPERT